MRKIFLLTLLVLAPALHAADKAPPGPAAEEPRRQHADPRFRGKVTVIGTSSESFGEAPKDNELKTRGLDDPDPPPAPRALPPPAR